jgi:hypothetical protein
MSSGDRVGGRAIVLQMQPLRLDGGSTQSLWLLTLTVMPDGGLPFRSRITAVLPDDASWKVHVGAHVPVRLDGDGDGDVDLDVAQLQAMTSAARQHPAAGSTFAEPTP